MNIYTIGFFGHRIMYDLLEKEKRLVNVVSEIIFLKSSRECTINFLVGRSGDFDELAASIVKRIKKEKGYDEVFLTLVLPYLVSDIEYYEKYYDDIIIPREVEGSHPKQAYKRRNEWIVEHSDLLIVNVENDFGGAYKAMKYAERKGKKIINIAQIE